MSDSQVFKYANSLFEIGDLKWQHVIIQLIGEK